MLQRLTNFNRSLLQEPNHFTRKQHLTNLFKTCSRLKDLESAYAFMVKTNENQASFVVNQFITACSRFRRTDYNVLAITQMRNPNVFVYNSVIKGFVQCGSGLEALLVFLDMLRADISATSYTFSSIVKACALASDLGLGEGVQGQIWKLGFASDLYVQTALVDFYSSSCRIVHARKVFDEMPERDVFVWTSMISGYVRVGDLGRGRTLFDEMVERNTATWNTMIDGYARIGDVDAAALLFNEMPTRDLISWTTMINCYTQNKLYAEAVAVFNEMKSQGISPDEVTMATVISACAHIGALDLGKEIHLYVMQNGFALDVYLGSALIDMYAKCGSLDRSLVVFFKLRDKNLFCWNSAIEGLAVHGFSEEALAMFSHMEKENVKPNAVTFISVLSACTHAGLVEEGRRRFLSMTRDYSILPKIQHYGCMIDLLCKAGLIEDALKMIQSMKIEPNAIIWGALLNGCKLHKKVEVARIAADKLMVLEPENSGHHSLLVNMYAEENLWGEVARRRIKMKTLGIEKSSPGSSWLCINSKVHLFTATDKSHPCLGRVYALISELDEHLKLITNQPEVAFT